MTSSSEKDHWSSNTYQAAASFVPKLTATVVKYLDPQPTDRVLDVGCGDGVLTLDIAERCSFIEGLDFSASMIQTAKNDATKQAKSNTEFALVDCSRLNPYVQSQNHSGAFGKVFSNAALHWILRNPETRDGVFEGTYQALKPGGTFVFECGGAGNVAEVVTGLIAGLVQYGGKTVDEAREAIPWFFASEAWMKAKLEQTGFVVEKVELEYRPTKLPEGLKGWIGVFGAGILADLEKDLRDKIVNYVCDLLKNSVTREDGTEWIGYVRLRGIAHRPS